MAGELAKALANRLGDESYDGELIEAMRALLILLLKRLDEKEQEDDFATELGNRIKNKYSKPSSLANILIPKPM